MAVRIDQDLIDDVLDGDPLLTPDEAGALLGTDPEVLEDHARRPGRVPSIRLGHRRRYRTSVINHLAASGPGWADWTGETWLAWRATLAR